MTEVDVWRPRAEVAVPAPNDTDSWVAVVQDILKIANVVYDTPFVPDGLRGSAPAVAAAMLAGREMGLGIMTSLANIDVIKGKPTQKALLMRAMIQGRGHKWLDGDVNDTRAVVRGCRKGESEWTEVIFTADQAKRAGIDLGKYPADKLYARATSRLARRKFADVIMGMPYSSEEAEDGDVMEDGDVPVGPAASGPAAIEPARRTAQRAKPRTQSPPPAQAVNPPAADPAATPPSTADAGGDLPPLPGEEEITAPVPGGDAREAEASKAGSPGPGRPNPLADRDAPGSVTSDQLTAIWTVLSRVYHFGADEKDQARGVCAQVLGIELKTSTMLSKKQAGTVLDTLAMWQEQAKSQDEEPRGYLMLMLQSAAEARGEVSGE